jgi:hypothetical protein
VSGPPKPMLGRLARVELRDEWVSEPADFTPWLAQPDNIALLGEAIGIELEVEAQEKNVGPFRADILCRDTITSHFVLIENQLDRTDHTHLGQLLTYAAGLDAVTIVWIASRFTDEHRAALDWLNNATAPGFNFFGLEIELWRIGESARAPKFNVISQPNDWTKSAREQAAASQTGALTDVQRLHLDFWTQFHQYMDDRGSPIRIGKAWSGYWTSVAVGRTGFRLDAWNNMRDKRSGVFLVLSGPDAKTHFHLIEQQSREAVDGALAPLGEIEWGLYPKFQMSQIGVRRAVSPAARESWPELDEWMARALEVMHALFAPIVKGLDASAFVAPEDVEGAAEPVDVAPSA